MVQSHGGEATSSNTNITPEQQLSLEQLNMEMQNLSSTAYQNDIPASLMLSLNEMTKRALASHEPSKKLYNFSLEKKKEKLVRIVSQSVPDGILPEQYTCNLHDIRVGGHGPDDAIYNKHVDIRQKIPRGTTIVSLVDNNNVETLDVVLYANRKFTGAVGDEDETQPENNEIWRSYCIDNPDEAEKIVAMDKLNGEAAHFSGRFIDGKFYIITGSKNVHMIIGCEEDIEKYEGDRFRIAKVVAKAVWKHLSQMQEKHQQFLFNLLHHTKSTVVSEILQPDNQHIVNLSDVKEPTLTVVCMTPTVSDESEISLTALPPHHCLELFKALEFTTASYQIIDRNNLDELIKTKRSERNKEGHVLYYVKSSEGGFENTIGMVKTKTIWYVIMRALREKAVYTFTAAKKRHGWSLEDRISSTHKRFNEIQTWMKFSNEYLNEWNKLSKLFLQWLNGEINNNGQSGENIRPQFPIIWETFLRSTGNQLIMVN